MEHGHRVINFKKGHFNDKTIDGSFTEIVRGTFKLKDSLLLMRCKKIGENDHTMLATYPTDKSGKSLFTIDNKYDSLTLAIVGIPYYVIRIPVRRLKVNPLH